MHTMIVERHNQGTCETQVYDFPTAKMTREAFQNAIATLRGIYGTILMQDEHEALIAHGVGTTSRVAWL